MSAMSFIYSTSMQILGMVLVLLTYIILGVHVYGYLAVIALVLKRRLGVFFGLTWVAIGIAILYNIVFNHFWATVIRPGGP